jgi:hypothetical protein
MPGANESYWYREWAFLNKRAQSRLKPAHTLVIETWEALISISRVP